MRKPKSFFIIGTALFIVSIIFTFLVKKIDIGDYDCNPSCPSCSNIACQKIGFSNLNKTVYDTFQYNETLYKVTNYLGYLPILAAGAYCIFGLIQLIKRKNLKKVDKGLFALAGLFVVSIATYFLFEKLAINHRPVLIDGELEASYPSSHTMLTICISFGIILLNRLAYKNKKPLKYLNIALAFLTAFIVVGRFFSGVHWVTDIIGGLLFASSFALLYYATLLKIYKKTD